MKPYCGKKEMFLSEDDIKRHSCNGERKNHRSICKVPINGMNKNAPCRYVIVRPETAYPPIQRKRQRD